MGVVVLPKEVGEYILEVEDEYVNNKNDPGGATKFGITQRTLTSARETIACLPESVKDLTAEQALMIYEALYWRPARCDKLPSPVDITVFDGAVNCGVRQGVKFLQEALNLYGCGLAVDGVIGKKTLGALSSVRNARCLCAVVLWRRVLYYLSLANEKPTMRAFLRGWLNRLAKLWQACL
ncbi:MAG TPA: glycosyl hydrolase 108 family protein [Thermosynergistes sp.]|nr:glycosyl hydrolase 108 family protein [Thermosynergistes sp.]